MSAEVVDAPRGGGSLTLLILGAAMVLFALVGRLPALVALGVGTVGVVGSAAWRRRRHPAAPTLSPLPALAALAILAAYSPAIPSAELFGGVATLALLLWLADDPGRPAGGGRRAVLALGSCGLGVAVAWAIVLSLPTLPHTVGWAGGLLALILFVLAWLLARESAPPSASNARA